MLRQHTYLHTLHRQLRTWLLSELQLDLRRVFIIHCPPVHCLRDGYPQWRTHNQLQRRCNGSQQPTPLRRHFWSFPCCCHGDSDRNVQCQCQCDQDSNSSPSFDCHQLQQRRSDHNDKDCFDYCAHDFNQHVSGQLLPVIELVGCRSSFQSQTQLFVGSCYYSSA